MERGTCELLRDGVVHCPCYASRELPTKYPTERRLGWMDPVDRGSRWEFSMPESFQYIHTGYDPAGRLLLYENSTELGPLRVHDIYALGRIDHSGRSM